MPDRLRDQDAWSGQSETKWDTEHLPQGAIPWADRQPGCRSRSSGVCCWEMEGEDPVATLADRLLQTLKKHRFQPVTLEGNGYVLEIRPYHGKLEAGFILWRMEAGQLVPVASGHTENRHLLTAEGFALQLPPDVERTIASLLQRGR